MTETLSGRSNISNQFERLDGVVKTSLFQVKPKFSDGKQKKKVETITHDVENKEPAVTKEGTREREKKYRRNKTSHHDTTSQKVFEKEDKGLSDITAQNEAQHNVSTTSDSNGEDMDVFSFVDIPFKKGKKKGKTVHNVPQQSKYESESDELFSSDYGSKGKLYCCNIKCHCNL